MRIPIFPAAAVSLALVTLLPIATHGQQGAGAPPSPKNLQILT